MDLLCRKVSQLPSRKRKNQSLRVANKYTKSMQFTILPGSHHWPIFMKFGVRGEIADIVM